MMTLHNLKTKWIKARIAYHRRRAHSYPRPTIQFVGRDPYRAWIQHMALRHLMQAHQLERELAEKS